jgi:6-phosphogluconate dehydrogenase
MNAFQESITNWHRVVSIMTEHSIAIPTIGSALSYFEAMTDDKHSANYIQ